MQNLSIAICKKLRDARRDQGLSQVELANEVGCKQPALSAFEKGNPIKLSEATVIKLSKRLGVSLDEPVEEEGLEKAKFSTLPMLTGFCPDHDCPSNEYYTVGDRGFWRVTLQGGKFCAHCGEVLEKRCPHCGAPLNAGACCSYCGKSYVV